MIFTALWHTLQDFAHGLGWIGLGVLSYFAFVALFGWIWKRFWDRVHESEDLEREARLASKGNPEFNEALFSRGPLPRPNERERVS